MQTLNWDTAFLLLLSSSSAVWLSALILPSVKQNWLVCFFDDDSLLWFLFDQPLSNTIQLQVHLKKIECHEKVQYFLSLISESETHTLHRFITQSKYSSLSVLHEVLRCPGPVLTSVNSVDQHQQMLLSGPKSSFHVKVWKYIFHVIWKSKSRSLEEEWRGTQSKMLEVVLVHWVWHLHASFCWRASWRHWLYFPAGRGTCRH